MTRASALYAGVVTHMRRRPRAHRLRYRVFMLLIDLDELDDLDRSLRLFSKDRFNLVGFLEADHGDGSATPLKAQIEAHLTAAGIAHGGPIRVLSLPRILGRAFNPLSVYFCHDREGRLNALLYEVSNTFGQRHSYLIPAEGAGLIRQACDKVFYVSPFMDMDLSYVFRVVPPDDGALIAVDVHDAAGRVMAAGFAGRGRALSDGALLGAWISHPWMTLGVLVAIHWEALKIWLRGEPLRRRPPAPDHAVTVVRTAEQAAA